MRDVLLDLQLLLAEFPEVDGLSELRAIVLFQRGLLGVLSVEFVVGSRQQQKPADQDDHHRDSGPRHNLRQDRPLTWLVRVQPAKLGSRTLEDRVEVDVD